MLNVLRDLLNSKKANVMVAGIIVSLAGQVGLNLDPAQTAALIAPAIVYIIGQAIVDAFSKLTP